MSQIWQGSQFAWSFIAAVVWIVVTLLVSDYAWRVTRMSGKRILIFAGGVLLLGFGLIAVLTRP